MSYDRNNIDRTVPEEENYYGGGVDLNFNNRVSKRDSVVRDNQGGNQNINEGFRSETFEDFDTGRKKTKQAKGGGVRKKRKLSKGKKAAIIILAIILLLVGSALPVLGKMNYRDKQANEYISSDKLMSDKSVKNILLLGVDARDGEDGQATRSDTMMLVSLDSKHHCVKLVSFLRDTWVYIPSLDYEQRLNAACSSGGYQNVVSTIEYNFGVKIDGYVVTDFEMFKVLVDSIGGVKIDVTEAEAKEVTKHKKRYGNVKLEAGKHKLTGEQALAYCRIRKIDTDFKRTERQRTVISAIIKKGVANPLRLYKMAYGAAPYIETDLTKGELIKVMTKAAGCMTGKINQNNVPFDGTWDYANINGNSVIAINREKNRDLLREYIFDLSSKQIEEKYNTTSESEE